MSTRSALDIQVGGAHYKDSKIQPVEYIHANGIGFMEGSAIKYLSRHKKKNGRQDVEKALHFCQLLLDLEYPRPIDETKARPLVIDSSTEKGCLVMALAERIMLSQHYSIAQLRKEIAYVEHMEEIHLNKAQSALDTGFRTESGHHFQD
jgi:hypothetical protein